ncbi:PAS domain S-box-containing protein/diguanylate cyclase (GGDEF)-like protein [Kushneria sinocarnis]|uniref:cyclic-guanylate-specific phosphodiesterase n=1 Tax=Kushneria sinocarnis TaxID=595502 RepID=A0A420WVZ5_9GAMM|nr:EAL domain-containing protein [Kushneria sinocarnis]RKR03260.1 PAS domain S-box-containing protein/diguanylate cyclase (GGDEF)-like protein [Kushneria sinocarnis]
MPYRIRALSEALEQSRLRERRIIDSASDAFVSLDANWCILDWNRAAERLFGWQREEVLGKQGFLLLTPEGESPALRQAEVEQLLVERAREAEGAIFELEVTCSDGSRMIVESSIWQLHMDGRREYYTFSRDVTERRRMERELSCRAHYDTLTCALNRTALFDHLTRTLADSSSATAVLLVDLDHFKRINATYGHVTADRVLIEVSRRLRECVDDTAIVARLSSDEFVVLVRLCWQEPVTALARRILARLEQPIELPDDSVHSSASIGIALATAQDSADSLLQAAEMAMFRAKRAGRGQYACFDPSLREQVAERIGMESALRHAIHHDELQLYYQPIVSAATGRIESVEALLRWHHPERGLIMPDAFIPLAEETGLIVPLGRWVIEHACRQAALWQRITGSAGPALQVSINLSARQIAQPRLVDEVRAILQSMPGDDTRLHFGFEVTETAMMHDPQVSAETLSQLRRLGAHLSLDDFGTGYSSMAYLKHLPFDTLKIDRTFTRGVAEDGCDRSIIRSMLALADGLGLDVIAEGVETRAQQQALLALGVQRMQGFLFARPQSAAVIERMLDDSLKALD